jgi:hypothetical protein
MQVSTYVDTGSELKQIALEAGQETNGTTTTTTSNNTKRTWTTTIHDAFFAGPSSQSRDKIISMCTQTGANVFTIISGCIDCANILRNPNCPILGGPIPIVATILMALHIICALLAHVAQTKWLTKSTMSYAFLFWRAVSEFFLVIALFSLALNQRFLSVQGQAAVIVSVASMFAVTYRITMIKTDRKRSKRIWLFCAVCVSITLFSIMIDVLLPPGQRTDVVFDIGMYSFNVSLVLGNETFPCVIGDGYNAYELHPVPGAISVIADSGFAMHCLTPKTKREYFSDYRAEKFVHIADGTPISTDVYMYWTKDGNINPVYFNASQCIVRGVSGSPNLQLWHNGTWINNVIPAPLDLADWSGSYHQPKMEQNFYQKLFNVSSCEIARSEVKFSMEACSAAQIPINITLKMCGGTNFDNMVACPHDTWYNPSPGYLSMPAW